MHKGWIATAFVAMALVPAVWHLADGDAAVTRERALGPNAVVVELFTSQG